MVKFTSLSLSLPPSLPPSLFPPPPPGQMLQGAEPITIQGYTAWNCLVRKIAQHGFPLTFRDTTISILYRPRVPVGLEDVSKYPDLVMELLRRGYTDDDVRKVVGKNLLRAMKRMEQVGFQLGPVVLVPLVGLQISCSKFARFIFFQYYKLSPNSLKSLCNSTQ